MNVWVKIIVFIPIWLLCCSLFYALVFIFYPDSFSASKAEFELLLSSNYLFLFLNQLATLFGTFCSILFVSRFIEKERFSYLNSILQPDGLFRGILIGMALIGTSLIILSLIYTIEIKFQGLSIGIIYYLIIFLIVAVSEEVMARGFILNNLYFKTNKTLAVIFTSLIFTLLHIFNSSISLISIVNIFLVGIIFSLLYLKKMSLSIPIGLHFAWNFLQGPVFGFSVSGFVTESIFKIESKSGSDFSFSGFGLEGSFIVTIVFVIYILYFCLSNIWYNRVAMSETN